MKDKSSIAIWAVLVSVIAIIVLVVSQMNTLDTPEVPTATEPVIPTLADTNTPDPCSPEALNITVAGVDKIMREFRDAFVLAQNTPARDLAPNISELQRIRRNAEDFNVPSCAATLKTYQLGYMNAAIDAALALYGNFSGDPNKVLTQADVDSAIALVTQRIMESNDYENKYIFERARLLGIELPTFTPTVTLEATVTATP